MSADDPVIISASRRTDMPRFYLQTLVKQLTERRFRWHHPFSGKEMELRLADGQRAVVVLWSKDFGSFLRYRDEFRGWPLFFHFTINTPDPILEPDLPPLDQRVEQLKALVTFFGAKAVRWRFDPIAWYRFSGETRSNLPGLIPIARCIERTGIHDMTVSFMDSYRKIWRRVRKVNVPIEFIYPTDAEQIELFREPAEMLSEMGFTIHTCCEPQLATAGLPAVRAGRCVDAHLLSEISGYELSATADHGQRRSAGCSCHRSIDVGCYTHHPCHGQCLYCYARR
jgi:hypothetical protein